MKNFTLILIVAVATSFASCSSTYKSTQTTDDLYYAPSQAQKEKDEEVKSEEETKVDRERNFISQKIKNRDRWSNIDDYTYWNDTRYNHCQCYCNNNINQFSNWNTYYNGWYNPYNNGFIHTNFNNPYTIFVPYKTPAIITPRNTTGTNVIAYNNPTFNNNNFTFSPKLQNNQSPSKFNKPTTSNGSSYSNPVRTFSTPISTTTPSTPAGGKSGGYNSSGSSSSTPRKGRG